MSNDFPYDVFISYSQKDRDAAERLQKELEARKLGVWRDERLADAPHEDFIGQINTALERSAKVIVLWSRNSVQSAWVQAEAEKARLAKKVVPLALEAMATLLPFMPTPFNILPTLAVDGTSLDLEPVLDALGAVQVEGDEEGVVTLVTARTDLSKLPTTYASKLYGREREMTRLVDAWDGGKVNVFAFDAMGGAGKTALAYHFVQRLKTTGWRGARRVYAWSFYSQGSNEDRQASADEFFDQAFRFFTRKSAKQFFREKWIAEERKKAEAIYDTEEEIKEAIKEEIAKRTIDAREKGVELARLVQAQRSLLILDGMEPLQYAAGARGGTVTNVVGGIKDPGVKALLSLLADENPGLCLVTTRIELAELKGNASVEFEDLQPVPLMAGIELLRDLGVEPQTPPGKFKLPLVEEFTALHPPYQPPSGYSVRVGDDRPAVPARVARSLIGAVQELKGHALALTLVGNFLVTHHHGNIDHIHELPDLAHLGEARERSPYRVMRAIEIALANQIHEQGADERPASVIAGRQLALLLFLGFFDRPAEREFLPVVFPAGGALAPGEEDLAVAATDLIPFKKKLWEFDQEFQKNDLPEWRKQEIERDRKPIEAERDKVIEAQRRVLFRRLFAGMNEFVESDTQITEALLQLAAQGLVAKHNDKEAWIRTGIDCHPLVREYFGARLEELDTDAFRAGHGRLYDYLRFKGLPEAFREPVAYGVLGLWSNIKSNAEQQKRDPISVTRELVEFVATDRAWAASKGGAMPPVLFQASPDQLRAAAKLIDGPQWKKALGAFLPDGEAGMTPLFAAIQHGCKAGRQDECFNEVYQSRITRGNQDFASSKLGLYGQELAALASLFDEPFSRPSPNLPPSDQALVLNNAGFQLRALGRLEDAAAPMRTGSQLQADMKDYDNAASGFGNLCELLLIIGRLAGDEGAAPAGEAAISYGDKTGDLFRRMGDRAKAAPAMLATGDLARAEILFRASERLQIERQPDLPRLYSTAGFGYGDLLLARGRAAEARERAQWELEQYRHHNAGKPLDIALNSLSKACASLALSDSAPDGGYTPVRTVHAEHGMDFPQGMNERGGGATLAPQPGLGRDGEGVGTGLSSNLGPPTPNPQGGGEGFARLTAAALAALRRANQEQFIPSGLLAHAGALRLVGDTAGAEQQLHELDVIAARGPMPLYACDAALLRARMHLAARRWKKANEERNKAKDIINETHYRRAIPELLLFDAELATAVGAADLDARLVSAIRAIRGKPYTALRTGDERIDRTTLDGGWWGLLPRLLAILPEEHPDRTGLIAARDAYNVERDAYLAEEEKELQQMLAKEWAEEDRALADPEFRRELSAITMRVEDIPLDDMPREKQREIARLILKQQRDAAGKAKPPMPEVPDELLDHLLGDPNAREMLEKALKATGIDQPLDHMPREQQRALVAALLATMKQSSGEDADDGAESEAVADIPDELVRHIFADPDAQPMLKQVMEASNMPGEPADLPFETQRAMVAWLVKEGHIKFGDKPD